MRFAHKIGTSKSKGFTLIEVIFSLFILFIVLTGFVMFSINAYQRTNDIIVKNMAQNLAQIAMEDLKLKPNSVLNEMVQSNGSYLPNYPLNGTIFDENGILTRESTISGIYHIKENAAFIVYNLNEIFPQNPKTIDSEPQQGLDGVGCIPMLDNPPLEYQNYVIEKSIVELKDNNETPYSTARYKISNGTYIEAVKTIDINNAENWSANLTILDSNFPRFYKEITIMDKNPSETISNKIYELDVKVIWTFNGSHLMVEIKDDKTDLF